MMKIKIKICDGGLQRWRWHGWQWQLCKTQQWWAGNGEVAVVKRTRLAMVGNDNWVNWQWWRWRLLTMKMKAGNDEDEHWQRWRWRLAMMKMKTAKNEDEGWQRWRWRLATMKMTRSGTLGSAPPPQSRHAGISSIYTSHMPILLFQCAGFWSSWDFFHLYQPSHVIFLLFRI